MITYGIDPRGLVWRQISPNEANQGQATTFQYDVLDRMVSRLEPDLSSYWVYKACVYKACVRSVIRTPATNL